MDGYGIRREGGKTIADDAFADAGGGPPAAEKIENRRRSVMGQDSAAKAANVKLPQISC